MTLSRRITLVLFLASLALFVVALSVQLTRETDPVALATTATPVDIGPVTPGAQGTPRPLPSERMSPTLGVTPSQEGMPWTAFLPGIQGPGSAAPTATATMRPSTATFTPTPRPTPSPTPTIPWPEALELPGEASWACMCNGTTPLRSWSLSGG